MNDNKVDLRDVTFLIPFRIDSVERLENLIEVTEYILTNSNTNILVLEASRYNGRLLPKLLNPEVKLVYIQDYDPVFYRTHYINKMVEMIKTEYLSVWDSDVLINPEQIKKAISLLREDKADFVYPYKEKFLDTSEEVRELYLKKRDFSMLIDNEKKMNPLYGKDPVGGAFLARKKTYIESGQENEKFYGWGVEDGERINRWNVLKYRVERVDGPLFHLTHPRNLNSTFHTKKQLQIKQKANARTFSMTQTELKNEINNWNRK